MTFVGALAVYAALGLEPTWLGPALIVMGVGSPLIAIFALGMKIPPRPEDAPGVATGAAVHGGGH